MTGRSGLWPRNRNEWLILAVLVLFPFLALSSAPLFDLDEGAFTAATTEMFLHGNFLSPHLLGMPRYDKPILIYWLQAASVYLFGRGEFAWRLPSALSSSLWILVTYLFVTRVTHRRVGLTAALIIATAAGLTLITRAAIADALLNLWLVCAGYAAWLWLKEGSRQWLYAAWLAMALGFLTKGPVAVVIPAGAVFLWCLSQRDWRRFIRFVLAPGPLLLFFAVAAPWFVAVTLRDGPGFLEGFFLKQNLGRFDAPMEGHSGNLFYYVPVVLVSLLPFTGLLLAASGRLKTVWRNELLRYGLLWFLLAFVLFSLSGTKLPHYVYYGYGGLVIVLAAMVDMPVRRWLVLFPAPLFFALLLALPFLAEAATTKLKPDDQLLLANLSAVFGPEYWLWCGGALLISLVLLGTKRIGLAAALRISGLLAGIAMAVLLIPIVGHLQQEPIRDAGLLAQTLRGPLVLFGPNTPSFETYADRQVVKRQPRPGDLVLTRQSKLAELPGATVVFSERSYILARMPRHADQPTNPHSPN